MRRRSLGRIGVQINALSTGCCLVIEQFAGSRSVNMFGSSLDGNEVGMVNDFGRS
jgi:hypothetical protein